MSVHGTPQKHASSATGQFQPGALPLFGICVGQQAAGRAGAPNFRLTQGDKIIGIARGPRVCAIVMPG
jgi:hypothetical protein